MSVECKHSKKRRFVWVVVVLPCHLARLTTVTHNVVCTHFRSNSKCALDPKQHA